MKNILLSIIALCSFNALLAQGIDIRIEQPSVTHLSTYAFGFPDTLFPQITIRKDSIIEIEAEAIFRVYRLSDGMIIHEEAQNVILPDSIAKVVAFEDYIVSALEPMEYRMEYQVTNDLIDPNPMNNVFFRDFTTGDRKWLFGHEVNDYISPLPSNFDSTHSWSIGLTHVFHNIEWNLTGWDEIQLSFYVGNPEELLGQKIYNTIYIVNEDANDNDLIDPEEIEIVGFTIYTFDGTESVTEPISMKLINLFGESNFIEDGKLMLFCITHENSLYEKPMQIGVDTNYIYHPEAYHYPITPGLPYSKTNYVSGIGGLLEDYFNPFTLLADFNTSTSLEYLPAPMFDISIVSTINTEETSKEKHQIKLLENPVKELLQLEINSQALQPRHINIYNTMGQALYAEKLDAMSDRMEISVGDFPNGTYHVIISGDNGNAVSTFVKTE